MRNYICVFSIIRKHAKLCVWSAQSIMLILVFHCNVLTNQFGWLEECRTNAWKHRRLKQSYTVKYFLNKAWPDHCRFWERLKITKARSRGAGSMFKLGGQDPSGGFESKLGEGHIPADHPDVQLVLNEVSGNKLLFSTGHGPPRSHPQTNYSAATLTERRPVGRTTSARKHDPTSPTARDGTTVPIFIIGSPVCRTI